MGTLHVHGRLQQQLEERCQCHSEEILQHSFAEAWQADDGLARSSRSASTAPLYHCSALQRCRIVGVQAVSHVFGRQQLTCQHSAPVSKGARITQAVIQKSS